MNSLIPHYVVNDHIQDIILYKGYMMGRMTVKRFLQHEDVIRWYMAEEGRKVWFRWSDSAYTSNPWVRMGTPNWLAGGSYVADDENAEQRKKDIDLCLLGIAPTKSEDDILVTQIIDATRSTNFGELRQDRMLKALLAHLTKTHPKAAKKFRSLW